MTSFTHLNVSQRGSPIFVSHIGCVIISVYFQVLEPDPMQGSLPRSEVSGIIDRVQAQEMRMQISIAIKRSDRTLLCLSSCVLLAVHT